MKLRFFLSVLLVLSYLANAQTSYTVSFENAVHHEATINANFKNLTSDTVEVRMSRTSPGRYALHEFMKNVYKVQFTDSKGTKLKAFRPNPYSWLVPGHDGEINLTYTLFANRGDGTYSQIDESHAHLNMPATFMYTPELENSPFNVTFVVREDLKWKVATQLKHDEATTYSADNLQYFMDSPTEISDFKEKSFEMDGQTIHFVLHDEKASDVDFETYFKQTKDIVSQEESVFGELPEFDYGHYRFLACYMPNASGDGMEHRNSTILTSTRSLADGGIKGNIGTVAHEFFHAWNVERIRPKSLEPFDFKEADMSGELWFAEGFTSYYDDLSLVRADVISKEDYVKGLVRTFNYVWNSPGRDYFNPIEMSYQAPFVDAARSVDEVNRGNTFISYYSYGSMLGLALDLSLREKGLNLDDYMKQVWNSYGKTGDYYSVEDLNETLNTYAGAEFGNSFFQSYIYDSGMPNFEKLLSSVGIELTQDKDIMDFGASVSQGIITSYPTEKSPAYIAGLDKNDKILAVEGTEFKPSDELQKLLNLYKQGDELDVTIERYGKQMTVKLPVESSKDYNLKLMDASKLSKKQKQLQSAWLKLK